MEKLGHSVTAQVRQSSAATRVGAKYAILTPMARWFNIGGPCNAAKNYMLSVTDRLPEVASLVRKEQYFVVHAPRQCGKTTGFLAFANEINRKGEAVAIYCSLETVQEFPKAADGIPKVYALIRRAARQLFSGMARSTWAWAFPSRRPSP